MLITFINKDKFWPLKNHLNKFIFDDIMFTRHIKNTYKKSFRVIYELDRTNISDEKDTKITQLVPPLDELNHFLEYIDILHTCSMVLEATFGQLTKRLRKR